ncbi:NAD(P)/FAD-dependent oxidoreductase [bacterium]|nr:NAD(P)/FAD-dependent oxidoreductase [bacterium]
MKSAHYNVVVVGAGFSGIYSAYRLRKLGLSAVVLEAADGIGGTWYWNRYPGARCDIPSMEYSFQFSDELQQEWNWSERYATQPEILKYLEHVADKFDLRRDIQLNTRVESASYDEATSLWTIKTNQGQTLTAPYFILGTGSLSVPKDIDIPGANNFAGRIFRTSTWPKEEIDFTGRRVGVIGTGSSALQAIPIIAEKAKSLHVYQRTATYAVPANNYPLEEETLKKIKSDYAGLRERERQNYFAVDLPSPTQSALEVSPEERASRYEEKWQEGGFGFMFAYYDLVLSKEANDAASEFVRSKIRQIVKDPKVAEILSPKQPISCKRMCLDIGYYETFNRENVTLVDLQSTPILEVTEQGVRTTADHIQFDDLVLATGFDAMTGAIVKMDIRGREGVALKEKWGNGPSTYLGIATAGFPNLFMVNGPGSPSVLTNMVASIEHHIDWISDCIASAMKTGSATVEVTPAAESAWMDHSAMVTGATLFHSCNSWYLGANVPGKARVFMPYVGGYPAYLQKCSEVARNGYEGFSFSLSPKKFGPKTNSEMFTGV